MKSVDQYGEVILELDRFVGKLDPTVRGEAFKFLLSREAGVSVSGQGGSKREERGISPQELLRSSGRTKLTDKAVVLAYWLEMHQAKNNLSSGDLKSAFEMAREKAPKNPSDVVASLVESGRLMLADKAAGVQKYKLTTTAIDEVTAWISSGKA